ncbi:TPA: Slp family lipoprotein [Morganella morganii subsp. morganii]|nr:Slp family lipoprotein [Morganella morganii subsp. morganii]
MMNRLRGSLKYGVVILSLALAGCATVPESIKGSGTTMLTDFQAVQKAPQAYKGMEARFGGRVLSVQNQPDMTQLEIAVMPLNSTGAPFLGSTITGRMYARINSFMEPDNFRDQYVTVVGLMNGTQAGKIGDVPYTFPVIDVTGFQRWHQARQVIMPPPVYGPDPWRWHNGYYGGGYYGGGWYYPSGPAVVQDYLVP